MALTDEILQVAINRQIPYDDEPQLTRSFQKARSVVGAYSNLLTGKGYDFRAFPSPVQAVGHAKKPLIPVLISVVPPERFPTGRTSSREIPSPQTANITLTSTKERFEASDVKAGNKTINRTRAVSDSTNVTVQIPLGPGQVAPENTARRVEDVKQKIKELESQKSAGGSQDKAGLLEEVRANIADVEAKLNGTTNPEVRSELEAEIERFRAQLSGLTEDPPDDIAAQLDQELESLELELTLLSDQADASFAAREAEQREASQSHYLSELRNRYRQFQESSTRAQSKLDELNTPITGPNRSIDEDPYARIEQIARSRERTVKDDLDFLRLQAEQMANLPPLFMYVNPSSFEKNYEFIVSDGDKVRDGYIVEFWGERQPTISASGEVGAFYVNETNRLGQATGGLAVNSRKGSYAYQQFLALMQTYRSNGYIYNTDERISLVGAVSIFYDGTIYTGSFDTFTMSHTEDKPFSFTYNWSFTVRFEQNIGNVQ